MKDFEGYRIYRTNVGFDLTSSQDLMNSLTLAAEFDSLGNDIGYGTGFSFIELSEPKIFEDDTTEYWYSYEFDNLLNGWQYLYSVTAFDEGDAENKLGSLESSPLTGVNRVLPGTPATSNSDVKVGVYPNPYYGSAIWDGGFERLRKIYFYNLPAECEITIYTLSGDIVKRFIIINKVMALIIDGLKLLLLMENNKCLVVKNLGLISDHDQAIATGLYLFSVKILAMIMLKLENF